MIGPFQAAPAIRRLLPEGRTVGAMPWVIGIMMFLTVLATAAGLALSNASSGLQSDIARKLTIQLADANAVRRNALSRAIETELRNAVAVKSVDRLEDAELQRLIAPWLGDVAGESDLPLPAMIDVELTNASDANIRQISEAVKAIAPAARIDRHSSWLAPLSDLISSLSWVARGLVALMAIATAATVVLAVRAALNTHGETIAIMHLLGANDMQISRLFERRIALDALFGGVGGFVLGLLVVLLLRARLGAFGSDLLGSGGLGWISWLVIASLPVLGVGISILVARYTVRDSLGKSL
jgi:cell division transport system permease protein